MARNFSIFALILVPAWVSADLVRKDPFEDNPIKVLTGSFKSNPLCPFIYQVWALLPWNLSLWLIVVTFIVPPVGTIPFVIVILAFFALIVPYGSISFTPGTFCKESTLKLVHLLHTQVCSTEEVLSRLGESLFPWSDLNPPLSLRLGSFVDSGPS